MTISIVIPAFNEENYIPQTLKSVVDNAAPELLEVLVVNNASTDRTAEVAAGFPKVRVINEPKKGLTRARQAGLNAAQGEILAFIDADTKVDKRWFEVLVSEYKKDANLICLSGPYHYFDIPSHEEVLERWWYNAWIKIWHWFIDHITVSKKGMVIMGGNFAAKKSALVAAGGFDTSIEFYGEDTDIGRRLQKVGKLKFTNDFWIATSARRLNEEGLIRTGVRYLANYLSVLIFKKPITGKHSDIR